MKCWPSSWQFSPTHPSASIASSSPSDISSSSYDRISLRLRWEPGLSIALYQALLTPKYSSAHCICQARCVGDVESSKMAVVEVVCVNKNLRALSINGFSGHQRLARKKALDREDASLMLGKSLIHAASTRHPHGDQNIAQAQIFVIMRKYQKIDTNQRL